jgi:hypothetical protein
VLQRGEPIGCDVNDGQRVGFLFVCHAAFYTESPSWVNEGQDDETGLRGAWLGGIIPFEKRPHASNPR